MYKIWSLCCLAALLLGLSGCAAPAGEAIAPQDAAASVWGAVPSQETIVPSQDTIVPAQDTAVPAEAEGLFPELSVADMVQQSSLIVSGEILEASEEFWIAPVSGGEPQPYRDYTLAVHTVLRGQGETVTVRVEGSGQGRDGEGVAFQPGELVLLFLCQPHMGGGYNTQGDYYYLCGEGYWFWRGGEGGQSLRDASGQEVSWSRLSEEIDVLSREYPVNETWLREEFLKNQARNLESGFLEQAEYDRLLQEMEQYAVILPEA